jgi:hypothetical protein
LTRRDEFSHLSDFALEVEHLHASAEIVRAEASTLHDHDFTPVQVAGLDRLIWRSPSGQLCTREYALQEIWTIPEARGGE